VAGSPRKDSSETKATNEEAKCTVRDAPEADESH
jgi:hypothetical protein